MHIENDGASGGLRGLSSDASRFMLVLPVASRHRKKINISTAFAGHRLGIKEVDDGIWLVSFEHYDLGYIDLEQKTLQPLDNPFSQRLSPMS